MTIKIEIKHLKTIKAIQETGSISKAADRLFTTQSALSHQIKLLETNLGTSLFQRKSYPVQFNSYGYSLLQLANDVLPKVYATEKELLEMSNTKKAEMRIALECHTCFDWLIPAMDDFREVWPQVELDIVSGFQTDPVGLLLTNRADMAILSQRENSFTIFYEPLFAYEMVAIVAKKHLLATKDFLVAEDFKNQTLITYPVEDAMLDLIRKILIPANITPKRRYSELTIAIIQLVASGRGLAALPYWAVLPYLQKDYVVAKRIGENGLISELYSAMRNEDVAKKYLLQFCQIIRERSFKQLAGLSLIK